MWMIIISLLPTILDVVMKAEKLITGIKQGKVKKQVALGLISNAVDAADRFKPGAGDMKESILSAASKLIDGTVEVLNASGVLSDPVELNMRPQESRNVEE